MNENNKSRCVGFDQLKRCISMQQLLERYGLLEKMRRSGESLSGVCPLHRGHNPTQFRVNLVKNCWICFGDCHTGGSIIDFVARMERMTVREAGLQLQDWFHVQPGNGGQRGNGKVILHPALQTKSSQPVQLTNVPLRFSLGPLDGSHPCLAERGLTAETIATFGIGCCPHGLLRGWIAIPIHDAKGKLVAYAGRWPGKPPEGTPKYRLPRGFRKSLELFNQQRAANGNASEPLVVVEGFFGAMHVWQAGHRRVVSLMGSMLSAAQEERIVEMVGPEGRVVLLFDEDGAGRKGRAEAQERLGKRVTVSMIRLEEGQQPDSIEPQELLRLIGRHAEEEVAA